MLPYPPAATGTIIPESGCCCQRSFKREIMLKRNWIHLSTVTLKPVFHLEHTCSPRSLDLQDGRTTERCVSGFFLRAGSLLRWTEALQGDLNSLGEMPRKAGYPIQPALRMSGFPERRRGAETSGH